MTFVYLYKRTSGLKFYALKHTYNRGLFHGPRRMHNCQSNSVRCLPGDRGCPEMSPSLPASLAVHDLATTTPKLTQVFMLAKVPLQKQTLYHGMCNSMYYYMNICGAFRSDITSADSKALNLATGFVGKEKLQRCCSLDEKIMCKFAPPTTLVTASDKWHILAYGMKHQSNY